MTRDYTCSTWLSYLPIASIVGGERGIRTLDMVVPNEVTLAYGTCLSNV
jgi:hypothetical protein